LTDHFRGWRVADCDDIRTVFAKLLIPAAAKRILLIEGESGLGKSRLTAELAAVPAKIPGGPLAALLDLKSGVDIHFLLDAFARKLRLRDVYLSAKGFEPLDRLSALFDALEQRAQPAVLLFDTFESGGTYAQRVEQNVLPIAAVVQWLRVVVAGKEVPDTTRAGRQELPAELPRVEQIVACSAQQCVCGQCGQETVVIGYESAEQLDVEPAKYFVRVTKREKRACKACEEQGVQCAPLPVRIIEKGLASDRVVIDTIVSKYADYVPLYRQSAILERETGIELSRATLDGWVMRVGELLRPITAAMSQELLTGDYIQADETPVGVQMHDGRGKNHQAYLWQYSRPGEAVVFDFRMGREREGPKRFLGNFEGILQSDGYGAYDHVGGARIVHAACWAHARRKFFDAVKLNPKDQTSIEVLAEAVLQCFYVRIAYGSGVPQSIVPER
jgi:transposase